MFSLGSNAIISSIWDFWPDLQTTCSWRLLNSCSSTILKLSTHLSLDKEKKPRGLKNRILVVLRDGNDGINNRFGFDLGLGFFCSVHAHGTLTTPRISITVVLDRERKAYCCTSSVSFCNLLRIQFPQISCVLCLYR